MTSPRGTVCAFITGLFGRDAPVPYPSGLERDGAVLLRPHCPPYFASMEAAVQAVVQAKVGVRGVFRAGALSETHLRCMERWHSRAD